ncbi:MAG: carboxypeptidase regulatory-like domain-containing protein [Gemmatimonadaceae bacterium]
MTARAIFAAGFVAVVVALPASSQSVSGRVTVGDSGLPARGTGIVLVDSSGRPRMGALTDSSGNYQLTAPMPGTYRLRVQGSYGLSSLITAEFTIGRTVELERNFKLSLSPLSLDTVRVTATRDVASPPGNPGKYDDFLRRRKLGFGHFITSADIERAGMNMTHDLLRGIPGMLISQSGTRITFQSKRCSGGSIPGMDPAALTGGRAGPDEKQQPMLFVDGFRVRDITSLNDIHPGQIEAMEVFQGAAQVPAEAKGDACAAIFVWLKSGTR